MLRFLSFKFNHYAIIEILGIFGRLIILLFQTDSLLIRIQSNIIFWFFDDCPIGLQFVDARVLLEGSFALQDVIVGTKCFDSIFVRFLFFELSFLILAILGFDVIILLWSIFGILRIILQIRRFIFFLNLIFWSILIFIGVFSNYWIILLSTIGWCLLLVIFYRLFTFQ